MRKIVLTTCMLLSLLAPSISFMAAANAEESQVTLNPSHDAYTCTHAPESNYGDAPYLKATITDRYTRFIWLKFDLSEVPDGAIITSATLELFVLWAVHIYEPETYNVSAHFCLENTWSESAITYLNQPDYNNTATSWVLIETRQWYVWDVTYAVKRQVDGVYGGEGEVTIFLQENRHHPSGFNVIFSSKEAYIPSNAHANGSEPDIPKLTVLWSGIIPEFPSLTLGLLLLVTLTAITTIYKRARAQTRWYATC